MNLAKTEDWRFCPSCHHMQNLTVEADTYVACPSCGDAMWSDAAQRRTLLRFKQAIANSNDTDVALLEGCEIDDLDDGHDETKRYKSLSHGPAPSVHRVEGIEAAAKHAIEFIRGWSAAQGDGLPLSFCVIAASEKSRDALGGLMQAASLRCIAITAQSNHTDARDVVHLATMHRAKGLEFDCVVVVAPKNYLGVPEETETQRKLLYVALTRAKRGAELLLIN